jgi:phosphoribosyl-ATP pyrophosphohydrolase
MKDTLPALAATTGSRRGASPTVSSLASPHARGLDTTLGRVDGAAKSARAADGPDDAVLVRGVADLRFHTLVMPGA